MIKISRNYGRNGTLSLTFKYKSLSQRDAQNWPCNKQGGPSTRSLTLNSQRTKTSSISSPKYISQTFSCPHRRLQTCGRHRWTGMKSLLVLHLSPGKKKREPAPLLPFSANAVVGLHISGNETSSNEIKFEKRNSISCITIFDEQRCKICSFLESLHLLRRQELSYQAQ